MKPYGFSQSRPNLGEYGVLAEYLPKISITQAGPHPTKIRIF